MVRHVLNNSSRTFISGNGFVACKEPIQDYIPPDPSTLVFWMDSGEMLQGGTTVRGGNGVVGGDGDTEMADENGNSVESVPRGGSTVAMSIRQRRPSNNNSTIALLTTGGPSAAVSANTLYGLGHQNGRPVLSLGSSSVGITGTWGPFATNGNWTMGFYLKMDRLVADYGSFAGAGPMTLLSCVAAGLNLLVPSGGVRPRRRPPHQQRTHRRRCGRCSVGCGAAQSVEVPVYSKQCQQRGATMVRGW